MSLLLQSCSISLLSLVFLLVYGAVHLQHQGGNIVSSFFPQHLTDCAYREKIILLHP